MDKKKSTAKKVEDRSVRANMSALIGVCACVAIVLAIIIFFVNMILQLLDVNGGRAMGILNLIKDITLGIAVCLSAYYYARGKKQWFKALLFACIIIYVVMAIVGFAVAL